MKKHWKQLTAALLGLTLLLVGLDIRFGTLSGPFRRVPVLMYHHFVEVSTTDTEVSAARFREQMTALRDHGFTAITVREMLDYVEHGADLPEKPVLITMDDGYTSNLTVAAPILAELGMRATVFVIGVNEGEACYLHTGKPFAAARFSYEEAAPWVEKGIIDVQSHTFDLHQLAKNSFSGREGVLPLTGESASDYREALLSDCRAFAQRRAGRAATELLALAYPFGYCSPQADAILREAGIPITFTIAEHGNVLRRGKPDTLRRLGRFNAVEWMTGELLAERLERFV